MSILMVLREPTSAALILNDNANCARLNQAQGE